MYKPAIILYLFCLVCFIIFSRSPDYFDSVYTKGLIGQTNSDKFLRYEVDSITYTVKIEGWGAAQVTKDEIVTVIYNPSQPTEASLYTFFAYWFKLKEMLFSIVGFVILFVAAIFITGKEEPYYYNEEEKLKKRKYKD